jgi:hypothetical protein
VPGSEASGKVANRKVRTEARLRPAGKPDCGVCTDEQKSHTEAMRSDEVAHHAEVQHLERGKYRNSRPACRQAGVAGIDTRIPAGRRRVHLTEGGPDNMKLYQEVSRGHSSHGQRAVGATEASRNDEGLNIELRPNSSRNAPVGR